MTLPQSAFAGVATPQTTHSPTADTAFLLYILAAGLGLIAILAFGAQALIAIAGKRRPTDQPKSIRPVIWGAAATVAVLALAGGIGLSEADSTTASVPGTPASYTTEPFEDPTLKVGHELDAPKGPAISVRVNGQQYLWRYTYTKPKPAYSYHDLVIPVGVTVMLDVTSSDVVHSWWVPQLGGSVDAVPGYVNKTWIRADKEGVYEGASTSFSGSNYQNMTTRVIVVSREKFESWLDQKNKEIADAMTALGAARKSGELTRRASGATGATGKPGVTGEIGGPRQ